MAYISQEQKKAMQAELKKIKPKGWRWSLSVQNYSKVTLTIQKGAKELAIREGVQKDHRTLPHHHYISQCFDGELLDLMQKVYAILNDGNHDNSDPQTDYFDVGWYVSVQVGKWNKPYIAI